MPIYVKIHDTCDHSKPLSLNLNSPPPKDNPPFPKPNPELDLIYKDYGIISTKATVV